MGNERKTIRCLCTLLDNWSLDLHDIKQEDLEAYEKEHEQMILKKKEEEMEEDEEIEDENMNEDLLDQIRILYTISHNFIPRFKQYAWLCLFS